MAFNWPPYLHFGHPDPFLFFTDFFFFFECEVSQSCLTLWDPVDCSLPGSSICGVFQARVLEWVAISFSRGSSRPRDWTWVSCIVGRCFTIWAILIWTSFNVFTEFVTLLLLLLMFCFFSHKACGILAPRPGIEPTPHALEGDVPTTGPPGKSPKSMLNITLERASQNTEMLLWSWLSLVSNLSVVLIPPLWKVSYFSTCFSTWFWQYLHSCPLPTRTKKAKLP